MEEKLLNLDRATVDIIGVQTIHNARLEIHGGRAYYEAHWSQDGINQQAIGSFSLDAPIGIHGNVIVLCVPAEAIPTRGSG